MATADEYAAWIVKNADKKGTPEFDIVAKAYQDARAPGISYTPPPEQSKPFGQKLNDEIANIPRQIGLTARHGIEGVGDVVDTLASPFRAGINMLLPDKYAAKPGIGNKIANALGLPTPATPQERVVGDAAKLMAGSAVPLSLASKVAAGSTGATQGVAQLMAANPLQQVASAGAAGGAGGYVRETGGNAGAQLAASLAAGVATPLAINGAQRGVSAINRMVQAKAPITPDQLAQIDVNINNALQPSGLIFGDLPANIQAGIRQDVQQAMNTGGTLSPDAVRRLADYRLTGATPTAATLTLDPGMVTRQKNLAKLGINSKDAAAQQLGQVENANNRQLITGLNDLGASQAQGQYATSQNLLGNLGQYAAENQSNINRLYSAAKDSQGRAVGLDPSRFAQAANDALDYNLKGAFVPENIRGMMNDFASGRVPLNVHSAEQFKTILGNAQRGATDGNVRAALGHIREALDNTPMMDDTTLAPAAVNGGNQLKTVAGLSTEQRPNIGQDAVDAFNAARRANRQFMQQVEGTPALAAAIDGVAPDAFFKQHVVGANVRDLASTLNLVGDQGRNSIRAELMAYIKSKALGGAADEVGNFSQSNYNKTLNAIGDQKLSLLFSPEEINQMRAIGRVASYEQVQPKGSAVNNSNTAGTAIAKVLDSIAGSPLLSKIPFGNALSQPVQNISVGIRSKQALDVPNALTRLIQPNQQSQPAGLLLSPAAFMSGDNRDQNSLLPRR